MTITVLGFGRRWQPHRQGSVDPWTSRDSGDALQSHLSMEDFAGAVLDEVGNPAHSRGAFTVGY